VCGRVKLWPRVLREEAVLQTLRCGARRWCWQWVFLDMCRRAGTIWKLCAPKQRESGNRTVSCPRTVRGFRVTPQRHLCNLWANLHSEPFPGQNDLQNYIVHTVVDMRPGKIFGHIHLWCMVWYSLIIISSIGSPRFTWLSSFGRNQHKG